ncbi:hypothetical protein COCON_G00004510 [Conger conger]|uniref:complement subcomponent C1r n=1 Tax=Conger conger TaxID=82655 RepID=A0A9Q1E195_CONCO|nr:complement C1r subcomponent-like [Conger conger]KAJ8287792.1 hypothetical protein COCON_G00004510 [Conger conger]
MAWIYPVIWLLCVYECWGLAIPRTPPEAPLHGQLQSPLYPQPYPASLSEQWDLSVPEGYRIKLTFLHLDVESSQDCYYDSVTVMYKRKVLGKFCGQKNSIEGQHPGNEPILSPGNQLAVVFQTDDSNAGPHQNIGFSAFYQAIDVDECALPEPDDDSGPLCSQICHNTLGSYMCSCHHGYELRPDQRTCDLHCGGGLFSEPEGVMSSPGYPQPSPHGLACQYHISVEPGFIVTLNFTGLFHIESLEGDSQNCPFHWLQVSVPGKDPMKLCGQKSPGVIRTQSHSVELAYHTDQQGLSFGWHLQYSTQRVQCESPNGIANGKVTPNLPQYLYRDYISVLCDVGYKLMMGGEEIPSYFSTCQNDGQWHIPLPECHMIDCGNPIALLNGKISFLSGTENKYLSVIQYHCNDPYYSLANGAIVNYTCTAGRRWKDHQSNYIIPTCFPVCGRPQVTLSGHQRVLGGADAPAGAVPWQVYLKIHGFGGASVIGDQWLLTAAHNVVQIKTKVVANAEEIEAYVGKNDVRENNATSRLWIASVHPHPHYDSSSGHNFNNDIALLKLREPITFNKFVMPLCLPAEGDKYESGKIGVVSGFGRTDQNTLSETLKYVELPLVDQSTCRKGFDTLEKTDKPIPDLTDNMFCAGFSMGGKDTCGGDSGGAFAIRQPDGPYWAAGIVSWGIGCGKRGVYGVYTRVNNYSDWIKKTMKAAE